MQARPRYGERYINIQAREPWTIRVLGLLYRHEIWDINPEFYCEVRFIYEKSGFYSEMPLPWFSAVYQKISEADYHRYSASQTQQGNPVIQWDKFPDYSWLDEND